MNLQIISHGKLVEIRGLDEAMIEKQATNFSLGDVAGVAVKSVGNARLGRLVTKATADNIIEALNTKSFSYGKRGPKGART